MPIFEESKVYSKENHSLVQKNSSNIFVDDWIFSLITDQIPYDSDIDPYYWTSNKFTSPKIIESKIEWVYQYEHPKLIKFNNDNSAKFSFNQLLLVNRNNSYKFITAQMIKPNDRVLRYTDNFIFELIETIDIEEGRFTTYSYKTSPSKMMLIGGWVAFNTI